MKSLAINSRLKLPSAMRWVLVISMAVAAALVNAAPAEVALPGYYRIDRDAQLQTPTTPKMGVRVRNNSQEGRLDWEAGAVNGETVRRSHDSPPEHQCLPVEMSREDWLSTLRSACTVTIGRPCNASEVQVQREKPDQWRLTYPLRLGDSTPQGIEQLRRSLGAPQVTSGMSPQERAQVQAALRQLPSASAVNQSYADLAKLVEADAASKQGPEAEMLRKQAQRLRTGNTEPIMTGTTVERWTRISSHCPMNSGGSAP